MAAALEARGGAETGGDDKQLRRGWCLGTEAFRKELLGPMKARWGAEHEGQERQETMAEHGEGVVAEELKRRRWAQAEWGRRAKGEAEKVAMAMRLRAETAMSVQGIAQGLQMGAPGYVNHLLYRRRKEQGE